MVKASLDFYPVTGPLLGLYLVSLAVFCISYILVRRSALGTAVQYYFLLSAPLFFFAVFSPVYEPIVRFLSGA